MKARRSLGTAQIVDGFCRERSLQGWWILGICMVTVMGCVPNIRPLQHAVGRGEYSVALELTKKNDKLIPHLAALIVENEVKVTSSKTLLLALPREITAGENAIARLAAAPKETAYSKMAQIVQNRDKRIKRNSALQYLNDEDSDVRSLAATTFAHLLERNELHSMLADINSIVRAAAVAALRKRPHTAQTASLLQERLEKDPMPHVRAAAARCATALGENHISLLIQSVEKDENMGVRRAAMKSLAGLKETDRAPGHLFLERYAKGPITELRIWAAAELAHVGNETGVQRMQDALETSDDTLKQKAAAEVTYANLPGSAEILLQLLEGPPELVLAAAKQLASRNVSNSAVAEKLRAQWKEGIAVMQALQWMGEMGDPEALTEIDRQLSDADVTILEIEAFRQLRSSWDKLVLLMGHPDNQIRVAAAVAVLGQLEQKER